MVVSTIQGTLVEISEEIFAGAFELPMDGLTDLSEVQKDLVFDARSIFSDSGEQVSISCKNEMKIEFRLLSDILEKSIFVKAGSFDVVTHERFLLMAAIIGGVKINWGRLLFNIFKEMVTVGSRQAKGYAIQICVLLKNVPALELGNSKAFPSHRILTKKMVHRYVVINENVIVEEVAEKPRMKRASVKRAVSQKRPATADVVEPFVSKKKRAKVGKADKGSVHIIVAQEAVPLQIVEPTPAAPAEQSPVPKRKSKRRRFHLLTDSDDEIATERGAVEEAVENIFEEQREATSDVLVVEETIVGGLTEKASEPMVENEPVVESTAEEVRTTSTDDVDLIIEQVIAETAQNEAEEEEQTVDVEGTYNESSVDASAEYIVTEPKSETAKDEEKLTGDESMSLEEILLTIPVDCPLPSALGEITNIQLGKSVSIPGINEGDWYKVSLPKIPVDAKGKAPLEIVDPVKGNTAKEQFLLIVADVDLLVQLRERVIDEVDRFFNSFSLKNLANLKIEDIYEKEEQVFFRAETDSTREALQRKKYILTKYRELLIRKFLEAHRINFVPIEGSSAIYLKVLGMLSNLHLFVLDELKQLSQAHSLRREKTCCYSVFQGPNRDRGAVIARSNTNIRSSCWIRTMLRVNGIWVIEPCAYYWKPFPKQVICTEISHRISYVDTLPPISEFFKVMKKSWADVCIEAAKFFVSGKILLVGSLNFCRAIAFVESTPVFGSRRPTVTYWGWYQLCIVFARYCLFGGLSTDDIRNFVSTIDAERSFLRDVQSVVSSVFVDQSVQSFLDQRPHSLSTSTDYSMHFVEYDIHLEDDSAPDQFILPSSATTISASLAALRESFSNLVANQSRDFWKTSDAHIEVMCKINHVERVFLDSLADKIETFRGLFKRSRQEAQNYNNALSLALKAVRTQNAILSTDLAASQKEVKDLQVALSKDFDDKLADICNELLEFRVETQGQLASLGNHHAKLIAYLNQGSDDKKGEDSSSRPQPPPGDQNRPSDGSGNRAYDPRRFGGGTGKRKW
ncbi:hypothetical protein F511_11713 [Dorcoceras hygrometricum]|uniref:Splicing factor 3B subunit 1-like n=1 Tax=Dorcoceras hygrometricum TaxID=472368 RepID=A0A2Z7A8I9_9LAMI|nr:hypothetical protein F511_11713 [Dorcoceras hygrometricum]